MKKGSGKVEKRGTSTELSCDEGNPKEDQLIKKLKPNRKKLERGRRGMTVESGVGVAVGEGSGVAMEARKATAKRDPWVSLASATCSRVLTPVKTPTGILRKSKYARKPRKIPIPSFDIGSEQERFLDTKFSSHDEILANKLQEEEKANAARFSKSYEMETMDADSHLAEQLQHDEDSRTATLLFQVEEDEKLAKALEKNQNAMEITPPSKKKVANGVVARRKKNRFLSTKTLRSFEMMLGIQK
jgi:hypothetical protein